ncbi:hypothetical protein [Photobacterium leiognathi]|uniref:hypothetical protein n=1 Tax=Photobacterium leiognathi TaxID=553611 RepID=UPI002980CFBE|nr:hypothetical protein [Photobacterium leiognathi]
MNKRLSLGSGGFFKCTLVVCTGLVVLMALYALLPFVLVGSVIFVGSKINFTKASRKPEHAINIEQENN